MATVILRRKSWPIIFSVLIVGIAIGFLVAVWITPATGGVRSDWQGIPIALALMGISGRIASCKAILRADALVVINPLRTHVAPKREISGAEAGDDGTLEVLLNTDQKIAVFAFGGSLVDRFRGTSGHAARTINDWLAADSVTSEASRTAQVKWTRCVPADWCLIGSVVLGSAGALWVALSGG